MKNLYFCLCFKQFLPYFCLCFRQFLPYFCLCFRKKAVSFATRTNDITVMIHRLLRSSWGSAKCVLAQPRLSRNQCSSSLATFVYGHRRICRHRRKGMARQIQHRRRDDTQRQNVPSDKPPVLLCRYDWQNFGQSDRTKTTAWRSTTTGHRSPSVSFISLAATRKRM